MQSVLLRTGVLRTDYRVEFVYQSSPGAMATNPAYHSPPSACSAHGVQLNATPYYPFIHWLAVS